MIIAAVSNGDQTYAEKILEKVNNFNESTKNPVLNQHCNFCEGLVLKGSKRLRDIFSAEEMLKPLMDSLIYPAKNPSYR